MNNFHPENLHPVSTGLNSQSLVEEREEGLYEQRGEVYGGETHRDSSPELEELTDSGLISIEPAEDQSRPSDFGGQWCALDTL